MKFTAACIQRQTAVAAALAFVILASPVSAQTATGVPNAVQGFATNRNLPIQIESASLEVRDKDRIATFVDNVRLVQGDTVLECKTLIVHYEGSGMGGATAKPISAIPGAAAGGSGIRKLEAKGGVVVTQNGQTATGNTGLFDMKSNTVTLLGNVVITQGQNVLRGDRLNVDLTSGVSRVESAASGQGQRVQGLFLPNANKSPNTTSSVSGPPPVVNSGPLPPPPGRGNEKPKATADKKPPLKLN